MEIEQFIKFIKETLPITRSYCDFRTDLHSILEKYKTNINLIDNHYFKSNDDRKETISKIEKCIQLLLDTVDWEYKGCHGEAYNTFKDVMNGSFFPSIELLKIKATSLNNDNYFFKIRKIDKDGEYTYKDMFHIPLNKREIIPNNRYSSTGYPCLYLGKSILDCWEELRRPEFDKLIVSCYKVVKDFSVYDLRIPREIDYINNLQNTLIRLPIVISCLFKVIKDNEPFKPEYLVPKMIIETIISNNFKSISIDGDYNNKFWGIIYTSSHIIKDFQDNHNVFDNIAFPVIQPEHKEYYCNYLASIFSITNPISFKDTELKNSTNTICNNNTITNMFTLEKHLNRNEYFVIDHLFIDRKFLTIPSDGTAQNLNIDTNLPYTIH